MILSFSDAVDEVLFNQWDPDNCVGAIPSLRNSYIEYIDDVVALAEKENAEEEIANYLYKKEIEDFNKKGDMENCLYVASIIMQWHKRFEDRKKGIYY